MIVIETPTLISQQDEWLHSLPPTDSGDNDDRHAKRKETERVSQPLCYADAATLPRMLYPSMHLSALTHTPPQPPLPFEFSFGLLLPHRNLSSSCRLQFFPYPYRKEGERDVGHLVDPSLFAPAHINHPKQSRRLSPIVPPIKGLMCLKVITSVFCLCFWC